MFSDSKTKGLNLEDMKLWLSPSQSILVATTAIAIAIACHVASRLVGKKYPRAEKSIGIVLSRGSGQA